VQRVDKHVSATQRNPGRDALIAEVCHNFSFRSARESSFGQPWRQFAEKLFIHGNYTEVRAQGPAIIDLATVPGLG
jgi:hypothetical protein